MINEPSKLSSKMSVNGTSFVSQFTFSCGNTVSIYDIHSMHGLNQLLGHVKFNNREFGDVLYRGQGVLFDSLTPSLFREWKGRTGTLGRSRQLSTIIGKFMHTNKISGDFKLGPDEKANRYKVEGVLQHYGVPTKCIDLVDNHWVALWMGLYECKKQVMVDTYYHYQKREIPIVDVLKGVKSLYDSLYQYILLLAVPYGKHTEDGIIVSDDYVTVDLRKAVASVFLRPHAQHAIVAERNVKNPQSVLEYDMASAVVGILRMRIDIVDKWLGNGGLVTQENLFPPPSMDKGYDQLLLCQDLLEDGYDLMKYV